MVQEHLLCIPLAVIPMCWPFIGWYFTWWVHDYPVVFPPPYNSWLSSLGGCFFLSELKIVYLERGVQSAFCFVRYSVTQIAAGKWYPQSLLESLLTFQRNKVVENIFVPSLLRACFLVGDDNSTGDTFMMCVVVFQVQFCQMCRP